MLPSEGVAVVVGTVAAVAAAVVVTVTAAAGVGNAVAAAAVAAAVVVEGKFDVGCTAAVVVVAVAAGDTAGRVVSVDIGRHHTGVDGRLHWVAFGMSFLGHGSEQMVVVCETCCEHVKVVSGG